MSGIGLDALLKDRRQAKGFAAGTLIAGMIGVGAAMILKSRLMLAPWSRFPNDSSSHCGPARQSDSGVRPRLGRGRRRSLPAMPRTSRPCRSSHRHRQASAYRPCLLCGPGAACDSARRAAGDHGHRGVRSRSSR